MIQLALAQVTMVKIEGGSDTDTGICVETSTQHNIHRLEDTT